MNDLGAVPPILVDLESVILHQRAQLIEAGGFVVSRRPVEVGVARPDQRE
jgi:hypothetical protein